MIGRRRRDEDRSAPALPASTPAPAVEVPAGSAPRPQAERRPGQPGGVAIVVRSAPVRAAAPEARQGEPPRPQQSAWRPARSAGPLHYGAHGRRAPTVAVAGGNAAAGAAGPPAGGGPHQPRARGLWTTPSVVVRRPDGSIVHPRPNGSGPGEPVDGKGGGAGSAVRPRPNGAGRRPQSAPAAGEGAADGKPAPAMATGRSRSRVRRQPTPAAGEPAAATTVSPGGESGDQPVASAWAATAHRLRLVGGSALERLLAADDEAREARNARLRRSGVIVGSVVLALVLAYAVFPVRTYLDQRAATQRSREQIEVLGEENERLEERADRLRTDEEIEQLARDQYNLVRPGEESYGLLPAPEPTTTTTTTTPPTTAAAPPPGATTPPGD